MWGRSVSASTRGIECEGSGLQGQSGRDPAKRRHTDYRHMRQSIRTCDIAILCNYPVPATGCANLTGIDAPIRPGCQNGSTPTARCLRRYDEEGAPSRRIRLLSRQGRSELENPDNRQSLPGRQRLARPWKAAGDGGPRIRCKPSSDQTSRPASQSQESGNRVVSNRRGQPSGGTPEQRTAVRGNAHLRVWPAHI
jgi:hypothetical protein